MTRYPHFLKKIAYGKVQIKLHIESSSTGAFIQMVWIYLDSQRKGSMSYHCAIALAPPKKLKDAECIIK